MHLQEGRFQIGEEPIGGTSPGSNPSERLRIDTHLNPESHTHLVSSSNQRRPQILATTSWSRDPPTQNQPHFDYEPIYHNTQMGSVMAQSSSGMNSISYSMFLRCCRHRLRFFVLLSLPCLYLLLSQPRRSLVLEVLSLLAFASVILISLNAALPRLPSIRLFLARSLPIKFSTSLPPSISKPVVWSIGSKPKSERHAYSGSWVQVYSNGDVYEGEFHKGKCSGSGVYYYSIKGRYEGDWVDEKYDGYGVETWARGSRYRGQYRQGLRHGIGVYRFFTGDMYAGEWSNGQYHGFGVHTCEDGSQYVGDFKWGVKHGLGHYHFRNGDTYSGEYFAENMHGFGIYRFGNGHQYEGAWHEGRRQGLGMYTFRSAETQSGHWQNGVLSALSTLDPASPYTEDDSKVLNAVQEAQRVAGRARNLEGNGIDERVNRVVAAANKAATAAIVAAVKAVQKQMHHTSYSDDVPTDFSLIKPN